MGQPALANPAATATTASTASDPTALEATNLAANGQPSVAASESARSLPSSKDLLNNQAQAKSASEQNSTVLPVAVDSKTTISTSNNPANLLSQAKTGDTTGSTSAITALVTDHASKTQPDTSQIASQAAAIQPALSQTVLTALPSDAIGHLAPRVGSQAWDEALSQRIVWMAHGAEQSATLSLNPPDLGPLRIVLNVSNNQASATFISQQPEVRQAIEAALPKLENMMMGAGIQLGQTSVRADTQGQPGQAFQFDQQSSSGNRRQAVPVSSIGAVASTSEKLTIGQGLVNTFV